MSASIISRTYGGITDHKLVLSQDECGRSMSIGSTWNQIRVLMRFTVNCNGLTSNTYSPSFFFGLCSGTTDMVAGNTTNFLGLETRTDGAWIYTAGSPPYLAVGYESFYATKKVGTTVTNAGATIGYGNFVADTGTRNVLGFEITVGSPNYTVGIYSTYALAAIPHDMLYSEMFIALQADSPLNCARALTDFAHGTVGGPNYYDYESKAIAFDQSAGALDTVNLWWGLTAHTFEISDIMYKRVS